MNIYKMAALCIKAIKQGLSGSNPCVILKMPPSKRESPTRRLVPRGKSPIGKVLSRMGEYDVVSFDAVDLLAWCVANSNGTITVDESQKGGEG